jgi:hypothetical protein
MIMLDEKVDKCLADFRTSGFMGHSISRKVKEWVDYTQKR